MIKNPPANTGDLGSIPGSGRSPGEGNGNPLQYSCLGNPMDRGIWHAAAHGSQRVGHDLVTNHYHHHLLPKTSKVSGVSPSNSEGKNYSDGDGG